MRKVSSPDESKMSTIGPYFSTTTLSVSIRGTSSNTETRLAIFDLPEAGAPIKTTTGEATCLLADSVDGVWNVSEVAFKIALGLANAVATELFQNSIRKC